MDSDTNFYITIICALAFFAMVLIVITSNDHTKEVSKNSRLNAEIDKLKNEVILLRQQIDSSTSKKNVIPITESSKKYTLDTGSAPEFPKVESVVIAPLDSSYEWAHLKGSVKGFNKKELQDAHGVRVDGSKILLVVCDGAGSKVHSKAGADYCASALLDEFSKVLSSNHQLSDEKWKIVARSAFLKVAESLKNFAESQSQPLADYGCTGIVVLANDNFVGCAHVGDGRAGFLDANNCWQSILVPYKGAEANATVFISMLNSENAEQFIRTSCHFLRTRAIVALSDGPEAVCWHISTKSSSGNKIEDPNIPSANFFTKITNQLIAATLKNTSQEELDKLWSDFLTSGNEKLAKESDDKTLLIAVRG